MLRLTAPGQLPKKLRLHNRNSTVPILGSLLTIPGLHANTLRVEFLIHLACIYCKGSKVPSRGGLHRWLNEYLRSSDVISLEDPVEDVFISNIALDIGNFRIFEGIWECNDFYLQQTIDALFVEPRPPHFEDIERSVIALLRLSEAVASRSLLKRWTEGSGRARGIINIPSDHELDALSQRVSFDEDQLASIGIDKGDLRPFIADDFTLRQMEREELGSSYLERHPLLNCDDIIVVALPTAISPAIRLYLLEWLRSETLLDVFSKWLRRRQADYLFNSLVPIASEEAVSLPEYPSPPEGCPSLDFAIHRFDTDKLAIVAMVNDDLNVILQDGFGALNFPMETGEFIGKYFETLVKAITDTSDTKGGLCILVTGGLGGTSVFSINRMLNGWYTCSFSLPNFADFVHSTEASLLTLWKLKRDKQKLQDEGLEFFQFGDDLNIYAYWKGQGDAMLSANMAYPGANMIALAPNFIHDHRLKIRNDIDKHCVRYSSSTWLNVQRANPHPYFSDGKRQPAYVVFEELKNGRLLGVIETERRSWWLVIESAAASKEGKSLLHGLWEALLGWTLRLAPLLEGYLNQSGEDPIHYFVEVEHADEWGDLTTMVEESDYSHPIDCSTSNLDVHITIRKSFRRLLNVAENKGERALVECMVDSIRPILERVYQVILSDESTQAIVQEVMQSQHRRSIHLFEPRSPGAKLATVGTISKARFIKQEDENICALGLAWRVDRSVPQATLSGVETCKTFLRKTVDTLWTEIAERLVAIDRESLVLKAIETIEAIQRDREYWRQTARALTFSHDENEVRQVSGKRESERVRAALSSRVIVEMGLCTCPLQLGKAVSQSTYDDLLARVVTLIQFASWSDAINYQLAPDKIHILPSGVIKGETGQFDDVVGQYSFETFSESLEHAIEGYARLYEQPTESRRLASQVYGDRFAASFLAEYGISVDECIDVFAELWDLAVERGTAIVKIDLETLKDRVHHNRRIDVKSIGNFFAAFGLQSRSHWDEVPKGFLNRDFYPWRYQRRLSLMMRPLVVLDRMEHGSVVYGLQTLSESLRYIFNRVEEGWMMPEMARSPEMKAMLGHIAKEQGHKFEDDISKKLTEVGWRSECRIQLSRFGASSEYGDVDVIAWKEDGTRLLAIESKRLKPARTVGEIGEQLAKFKGDAKDLLDRHLKRVVWLQSEMQRVKEVLRLPQTLNDVTPLLVTNTSVPMQFCGDLPLRKEQIIPIAKLSYLDRLDL